MDARVTQLPPAQVPKQFHVVPMVSGASVVTVSWTERSVAAMIKSDLRTVLGRSTRMSNADSICAGSQYEVQEWSLCVTNVSHLTLGMRGMRCSWISVGF